MEKLIKKVEEILNDFSKQEMDNRLTLKEMLLKEIRNYKSIQYYKSTKSGVKKEDVKK